MYEKRKAGRLWHTSRNPEDKTNQLNRLARLDKIRAHKNTSFRSYLGGLQPNAETDYSLWKVTRKIKIQTRSLRPIRNEDGLWARSYKDTADTFANYVSGMQLSTWGRKFEWQCPTNPSVVGSEPMKLFNLKEVVSETDSNVRIKESPCQDQISNQQSRVLFSL